MFIAGLFAIAIAIAILIASYNTAVSCFFCGFLLTFGFVLCAVDYYTLYNKLHDIDDKIKNMEDNNNADE